MHHLVLIIGNLGSKPELKYMQSGKAVTNLSVATNRRYTNANGDTVKETIWFRVSCFSSMAENCTKYLKKGSKVYVEARLKPDEEGNPRTWEARDGTVKASYEVIAQNIRFLDNRQDGRAEHYDEEVDDGIEAWTQLGEDATEDVEEDDYPF